MVAIFVRAMFDTTDLTHPECDPPSCLVTPCVARNGAEPHVGWRAHWEHNTATCPHRTHMSFARGKSSRERTPLSPRRPSRQAPPSPSSRSPEVGQAQPTHGHAYTRVNPARRRSRSESQSPQRTDSRARSRSPVGRHADGGGWWFRTTETRGGQMGQQGRSRSYSPDHRRQPRGDGAGSGGRFSGDRSTPSPRRDRNRDRERDGYYGHNIDNAYGGDGQERGYDAGDDGRANGMGRVYGQQQVSPKIIQLEQLNTIHSSPPSLSPLHCSAAPTASAAAAAAAAVAFIVVVAAVTHLLLTN